MVVIDAGRGRITMSISPGEDDEGLTYELGRPAERREP